MNVVVAQLKGLVTYLEIYRVVGFVEASKEIASEMEIKFVFYEKCIIRKRRNLMSMLVKR